MSKLSNFYKKSGGGVEGQVGDIKEVVGKIRHPYLPLDGRRLARDRYPELHDVLSDEPYHHALTVTPNNINIDTVYPATMPPVGSIPSDTAEILHTIDVNTRGVVEGDAELLIPQRRYTSGINTLVMPGITEEAPVMFHPFTLDETNIADTTLWEWGDGAVALSAAYSNGWNASTTRYGQSVLFTLYYPELKRLVMFKTAAYGHQTRYQLTEDIMSIPTTEIIENVFPIQAMYEPALKERNKESIAAFKELLADIIRGRSEVDNSLLAFYVEKDDSTVEIIHTGLYMGQTSRTANRVTYSTSFDIGAIAISTYARIEPVFEGFPLFKAGSESEYTKLISGSVKYSPSSYTVLADSVTATSKMLVETTGDVQSLFITRANFVLYEVRGYLEDGKKRFNAVYFNENIRRYFVTTFDVPETVVVYDPTEDIPTIMDILDAAENPTTEMFYVGDMYMGEEPQTNPFVIGFHYAGENEVCLLGKNTTTDTHYSRFHYYYETFSNMYAHIHVPSPSEPWKWSMDTISLLGEEIGSTSAHARAFLDAYVTDKERSITTRTTVYAASGTNFTTTSNFFSYGPQNGVTPHTRTDNKLSFTYLDEDTGNTHLHQYLADGTDKMVGFGETLSTSTFLRNYTENPTKLEGIVKRRVDLTSSTTQTYEGTYRIVYGMDVVSGGLLFGRASTSDTAILHNRLLLSGLILCNGIVNSRTNLDGSSNTDEYEAVKIAVSSDFAEVGFTNAHNIFINLRDRVYMVHDGVNNPSNTYIGKILEPVEEDSAYDLILGKPRQHIIDEETQRVYKPYWFYNETGLVAAATTEDEQGSIGLFRITDLLSQPLPEFPLPNVQHETFPNIFKYAILGDSQDD